ncbi:MAG: PD40 domain-containing protein [Deltaproteobacteria bacterium]|nr:PD40 domain-containing protein [Deltaproteobacteria bacterium]
MSPRCQRLLAVLVGLALSLIALPSRAEGDPYLQWWTIRTPHARVHYYKGCDSIAQRVADLIENLHQGMAREMGWSPREVTEVVLTDDTDDANGSATAIPYNTLRLYITAPDDMSPLGDNDDWQLNLVSHEYTHILQTDHVRGVPAIINAVLGKTLVPNQAQPRWILEGVATLNESRHSSAGRMRSSMFDMYLRADVLADRIVPLDQMSNYTRRWPQGNIWYLYGSRFLGWITDTYGFDVITAITTDTSDEVFPYGINRIVRRATGKTYEELYAGWLTYLRKHYAEQLAPAQARGLREGVQLTSYGQWVGRPRFFPRSARTSDGWAELLYYRQPTDGRAGFYRSILEDPTHVRSGSSQLVARVSGNGSASFAPDGSLFFNSSEIHRRVYSYNDIVRLPPRTRAPSGLEPERQRLTWGHRTQDPDVSPDGRHITFTVNHRGTTVLEVANLTAEGGLDAERVLVGSARFDQAYTPRFSPDGTQVAYSAWTRGGYRDIRIVDVATGRFRELMHDRAFDAQPSFTPDGRYLLFSSDRTGIANIYAFELANGKLWQVTNVRTGAYQPVVSPDGSTLVYVGYTTWGFDLFSMPFDPASFLPALPYVNTRPDVPPGPPHRQYETVPYNPLPSFRPRAWQFEYGPGTWGQALTIRTTAQDALLHHGLAAAVAVETTEGVPYAGISYGYYRLPFNFTSTLFRALSPRKDYRFSDTEPLWLENTVGLSNGVSYTKATPFDAQTWALNYSVARFTGQLPVGSKLDPYAQVGYDPPRGFIGVVHGGWAYSNVEYTVRGVGPSRGFSLGASADVGDQYTASQWSVYAVGWNGNLYVPMPWGASHTVAIHGAGAAATGDYPRRGLYYVGGFTDTDLMQAIRYQVFQGSYVLRGYKPVSFIGSQYHLYNVEYRFPIITVDHGPSTLPVFLQRVNGNLFLDYGGSFDTMRAQNWHGQFHTGVGAELWTELQIGYYTTINVRFGYAKGFGQYAEEGGQKYMVISAPY